MVGNKTRSGWLGYTRREIKYYLSASILILFGMWGFGYLFLLNSSDYAIGLAYVKANPTITETLGKITSARPGFVNFQRHLAGSYRTAKFNVVLKGEKSSGVVYLDLEGSEVGWKVNGASLETGGRLINLTATGN